MNRRHRRHNERAARARAAGPTTDPRQLGGDVIGGSPHGRGDSLVDVNRALLLDHSTALLVAVGRAEAELEAAVMHGADRAAGTPKVEQAVALLLEGRVNRTPDRARVLVLLSADGAAGLVSELVALAGRGTELAPEFRRRMFRRLDKLAASGNLTGGPREPSARPRRRWWQRWRRS